MKKDFVLEVHSENGFSVLNRMINIFNRRRVRIKRLLATEMPGDYKNGMASFIVHATEENMERVRLQLEKLIEVERTDVREMNLNHQA
ncbi:ACT domain-containing protein [Daejeonella oryzae]|jgi:acetolactate synthase small subunit|uniref:ACT domain-containing protein n=1 Tax=Daejeonella oryzae TaxID=1122943 RepID=UPI0004062D7B|nr:ACT domain-containing protein [Daejeonella oryzae]